MRRTSIPVKLTTIDVGHRAWKGTTYGKKKKPREKMGETLKRHGDSRRVGHYGGGCCTRQGYSQPAKHHTRTGDIPEGCGEVEFGIMAKEEKKARNIGQGGNGW